MRTLVMTLDVLQRVRNCLCIIIIIIWETVLHVKRPNQEYQSTEGKDATKVKPRKCKQHKIQQ